jgi:hypothetical protein
MPQRHDITPAGGEHPGGIIAVAVRRHRALVRAVRQVREHALPARAGANSEVLHGRVGAAAAVGKRRAQPAGERLLDGQERGEAHAEVPMGVGEAGAPGGNSCPCSRTT